MRRMREWFPAGVWSGFGLGLISAITAYSASGPHFSWWKTVLVFFGCCFIQICGVAEGRKQQEDEDNDAVIRASSSASISATLANHNREKARRLEEKLRLAKDGLKHVRKNALWGVEANCDAVLAELEKE